MCRKQELDCILEILSKVYQSVYGENLEKVILYGSYARGDYDSESDIDVVALVRGDRKQLQEQLKQIWDVSAELELQYGTIVSPTVIPYEEYEQYREDLPYYRNIEKEGVEIVA